MRKFVCLFLLAMAQPLWAWDAVPQKVADGVYAFIGETGPRTVANEGMNANTGFIITDAGVVVIDSGSSRQVAQKIESAIRQLTPQPITLVINTGGQDHRWLGNGHFAAQGIPLLAHEKTVADIAERGGMLAGQQVRRRQERAEAHDGAHGAWKTGSRISRHVPWPRDEVVGGTGLEPATRGM